MYVNNLYVCFMNPNPLLKGTLQTIILKLLESKSLAKTSLYRETYIEFYDHILSALEAKPDTMDFRVAVESIIADDFGGYSAMRTIETRYQKTIMREMQRKYLGYLIDCLKFPI